MRLMNEILQGMRLIKLRAWEEIFERKIRKARNDELRMLDKDSFYWTLISKFEFRINENGEIILISVFHLDFLTHASSVLTTLFTFGIYFWIEERSLEAGNVFASLALFSQLTVPLLIFPVMIPIIINAMVNKMNLPKSWMYLPKVSLFRFLPPEWKSFFSFQKSIKFYQILLKKNSKLCILVQILSTTPS